MSIETSFERIAVALEEIAEFAKSGAVNTPAPAPVTTKKKQAPEAAPVEEDVAPAGKAYTKAEVLEGLKAHADEVGSDLTIKLMIKHGADATVTRVDTIPVANYGALMTDVERDLAKKSKGKIA